MNYIYLLVETETQAPLYVGKTVNLARRLGSHSKHWLEKHGFIVEMIILEECERPWQEAEIEWIAFFRQFCKIENKLDGGNEFRYSRIWTSNDSSKGAKVANANRKGKKRPELSARKKGIDTFGEEGRKKSKSSQAIAKRMQTMKENGNYGRTGRLRKDVPNPKNKALIEQRKFVRDFLGVSWKDSVDIVKVRGEMFSDY